RVGLDDRDELRAAGGGVGGEAAEGHARARRRTGVSADYERLPERKEQPRGAARLRTIDRRNGRKGVRGSERRHRERVVPVTYGGAERDRTVGLLNAILIGCK